MTILISFFFQFQEKKKIGLHKLFFVFFLFLFHSIPCIPILILRIPTPYYMHSYPNSPHSYPDFLHSQPDSMHSHPHSPHSHPDSLHSHPDYPRSHLDSLCSHHFPHSVPQFPIPGVTDSL